MTDHHYMQQAYALAQRAYAEGEIPIGAIVVLNQHIVGRGYNQTERLQDPTAHAEMLAITAATETLGSKYLVDCTLYVTIEPCVMCAGASRWAQLRRIVFGAAEPKVGFSQHGMGLLHPKTVLEGGVMEEECRSLMQQFFAAKRGR